MKPEKFFKRVMRMPTIKNLGVLVLITFLLVGSVLVAYYVVINTENVGPGILITINLYDINTEEKKIVDVTSKILNDPEVLTYLEINAIAPPSPEFKEDMITIIKANMKPKKTIFIKSNKLLNVSSVWVSTYISRNGNPEETYSGLIIRLFIYNSSSGDVLFEVYDSISYKPAEITKEKSIRIEMSLVRSSLKPIKIDTYHDIVTRYEAEGASIEESAVVPGPCPPGWIGVIRQLVASINVENLTTELPSDYFKNVGGVLYVKTPVLIVNNWFSYSGVVTASIIVEPRAGSVGVYPTFTSGGYILDEIMGGVTPSVTLWKGSGFTWGGSTYYFSDGTGDIGPYESAWTWIWARPTFRIYKIYMCLSSYYIYLKDDVENFITDILTSGSEIGGGGSMGLPHSNLMQMLFEGTNITQLQIPNTSLADGKLDPGESIAFGLIFQNFDTCGDDSEVGIPAGSLAALGVCAALNLGAPACSAAVKFASSFEISLSRQGSSIYIGGFIKNFGRRNGRGYNVPEYVYIAISRYRYRVDPPWWCPWCSPCYYKVPAGVYFRCD